MEYNLPFSKLTKGMKLPEIERKITQKYIDLYAKTTGDLNPIHIDPDFATNTPFKGTIAHGMMILAYVSQMITGAFGQKWFDSSYFDMRFKTPARPGDTLTIGGIIRDFNSNKERVTVLCDIFCRNQRSEPVVIGEVKLQA